MTTKELKQLVKTLRVLGVTYYKTDSLELHLDAQEFPIKVEAAPLTLPTPLPEEDSKIVHKIEQLKDLMQLGDMQLIDRLFPDTTQYPTDDEVSQ